MFNSRTARIALGLAAVLLGGLGVIPPAFSPVASAQAVDVSLRVAESAGIAREGEVVTSGIPIPIDRRLLDAGNLCVYDDRDQPLPTQFKVLSRWRGRAGETYRPIKWLLVSFPADLNALTERHFRLGVGRAPAPREPVRVTETSAGVAVDTGPLQFTVSRTAFNLFDTVHLNQRRLVKSDLGNGLVIRDHRGQTYRSVGRPPETVRVEEAGPVRAVIRVEGMHADASGDFLRYIVRIHAYAGQPYVRVFYALRNDESYGYKTAAGHRYFKDVHVDLKLDLGTGLTATFREEAFGLGAGAARSLEVDMVGADSGSRVTDQNLDLWDNFVRRIRDEKGHILTSAGGIDGGTTAGRDPGFMDLGNSTAGVTIGVRAFWENFPKSLLATAGGLVRVGLWPEFGEYVDPGYFQRTPPPAGALQDYTFGGGRQKTHEMLFHFRTRDAGTARVRESVAAFQEPLLAQAPTWYHGQTGAIDLFLEDRAWDQQGGVTRELGTDLERFERFQRARVDDLAVDNQHTVGKVTYLTFRRRGGTHGGRQFYGWMNFGDTPWGDGYCSGHYDWAYGTLLSYLRSGDTRQFWLGEQMARHRLDIDQYHTVQDLYNVSGGQRFEKGEHHGDMTVPPTPSHTWVHGMLLYWALSGDEFAREAAEETLAFYRGYWMRVAPPFCGLGTEARTGGWSLFGLVELYDYLGEPEALVLARRIVDAFIAREQAENTSGYFMDKQPYIMPWMFGIFMAGLGKYWAHTGQSDVGARDLLDRMADWFVSGQNGFGPLVGGTGSPAAYRPYAMWYKWHPDPNLRSQTPRVNLIHIVDGLAYAYMATGKDVYLDTAIRCSSDLWRYWTLHAESVQQGDPKQFEPITMRPFQFPTSESKILGWMMRYGKAVQYAAYMREAMPPILVDVEPKGDASPVTTLRIRVTRNRPILVDPEIRDYDGVVRVDGQVQTDVVYRYFRRALSPFSETWYAPIRLAPNQKVGLDIAAWSFPWLHRVATEIRAVGQ